MAVRRLTALLAAPSTIAAFVLASHLAPAPAHAVETPPSAPAAAPAAEPGWTKMTIDTVGTETMEKPNGKTNALAVNDLGYAWIAYIHKDGNTAHLKFRRSTNAGVSFWSPIIAKSVTIPPQYSATGLYFASAAARPGFSVWGGVSAAESHFHVATNTYRWKIWVAKGYSPYSAYSHDHVGVKADNNMVMDTYGRFHNTSYHHAGRWDGHNPVYHRFSNSGVHEITDDIDDIDDNRNSMSSESKIYLDGSTLHFVHPLQGFKSKRWWGARLGYLTRSVSSFAPMGPTTEIETMSETLPGTHPKSVGVCKYYGTLTFLYVYQNNIWVKYGISGTPYQIFSGSFFGTLGHMLNPVIVNGFIHFVVTYESGGSNRVALIDNSQGDWNVTKFDSSADRGIAAGVSGYINKPWVLIFEDNNGGRLSLHKKN